jgi:hypothetical protein
MVVNEQRRLAPIAGGHSANRGWRESSMAVDDIRVESVESLVDPYEPGPVVSELRRSKACDVDAGTDQPLEPSALVRSPTGGAVPQC